MKMLGLIRDMAAQVSTEQGYDASLQGHDEEQIRLMEERCIVTDREDHMIRDGSKKECHLMTNINQGLLHRAFSVFLFPSKLCFWVHWVPILIRRC